MFYFHVIFPSYFFCRVAKHLVNETYTFKSQLSKEEHDTLLHRLAYSNHSKRKEMEQIRDTLHEFTFKPEINKKSKLMKPSTGDDYEQLYEERKQFEEKKNLLKKVVIEYEQDKLQGIHVKQYSEHYIQQMHTKRVKDLFHYLKDKQKDVIDPHHISSKKQEFDLEWITAIINAIEIRDTTMNQKEFVEFVTQNFVCRSRF